MGGNGKGRARKCMGGKGKVCGLFWYRTPLGNQTARTHVYTNETKRFPVWPHSPTSDEFLYSGSTVGPRGRGPHKNATACLHEKRLALISSLVYVGAVLEEDANNFGEALVCSDHKWRCPTICPNAVHLASARASTTVEKHEGQ